MATKQKLSATNLKNVLWETLLKVKSEKMEQGQANSIARQAKEILRTVNVQLKTAVQSNRNVPKDVLEFSENQK